MKMISDDENIHKSNQEKKERHCRHWAVPKVAKEQHDFEMSGRRGAQSESIGVLHPVNQCGFIRAGGAQKEKGKRKEQTGKEKGQTGKEKGQTVKEKGQTGKENDKLEGKSDK